MLLNQNIICISSIDWGFLWQGHQEIMSAFARNGNRVLFIENTGARMPGIKDAGRIRKRLINWAKGIKGFRQVNENLYVYSPVFLPFPYSRLTRWINRVFLFGSLKKWARLMNFKDVIVWTFLPTGTALDIINEFNCKCLVYYCIADFGALVKNVKKVQRTENALIKESDLIFAQGKAIEEKCKRLNEFVYVFPFGVNINVFDHSKDFSGQNDIKKIKKPIIGYVGGIHRHIDFDLLSHIARGHPEWSVVLVGPIQTDISSLSQIPNIMFLGQKDFRLLPAYIREFDVCIIPYAHNEFTKTVYPTKLNEYHALGKPVVSTDLPELIAFNKDNDNIIFISRSKEEFVKNIQVALFVENRDMVEKRIESTKKHRWDARIQEMSDLIDEALARKSKMPFNWQETFSRFYKVSRRKLFKLFAAVLSAYFLLFYTPVIWFMAEPLKISQAPQKADCIVVLGGGVGESGKAGQGYEERVEYAVELYRQGYAKHLIFSSGYMYVYEEPLIMKALAVSLRVPDEAIILEDKAVNTYENVIFTEKILTSRNWSKILLVSAPYHMKRLSLVAKKNAPQVNIIYSPIPQSRFYQRGIVSEGKKTWKQINLKQIKGLLHEYLGIAYYWWKGYI